jgi:hypothetical protein
LDRHAVVPVSVNAATNEGLISADRATTHKHTAIDATAENGAISEYCACVHETKATNQEGAAHARRSRIIGKSAVAESNLSRNVVNCASIPASFISRE